MFPNGADRGADRVGRVRCAGTVAFEKEQVGAHRNPTCGAGMSGYAARTRPTANTCPADRGADRVGRVRCAGTVAFEKERVGAHRNPTSSAGMSGYAALTRPTANICPADRGADRVGRVRCAGTVAFEKERAGAHRNPTSSAGISGYAALARPTANTCPADRGADRVGRVRCAGTVAFEKEQVGAHRNPTSSAGMSAYAALTRPTANTCTVSQRSPPAPARGSVDFALARPPYRPTPNTPERSAASSRLSVAPAGSRSVPSAWNPWSNQRIIRSSLPRRIKGEPLDPEAAASLMT